MTHDELFRAKRELEVQVYALLKEFQATTGFAPTDVVVSTVSTRWAGNSPTTVIENVQVRVEL